MTSVVNTNLFAHFAANVADTAHADGEADALYVGGAGDVVVVRPDDTNITFSGVPAGTVLPVKNIRVEATGTTATGLIALYTRKP